MNRSSTNAGGDANAVLWDKVVQDYRQLCILRRQGLAEESSRILRGELPASIAEWSERDPADGATKKRRLNEMFQQEQRRLDDVWFLQDIIEKRLRAELIPAISAKIGEGIRVAMSEQTANPAPIQPAPAPASQRPATPVRRTENPAAPARPVAGDIPSVIDLIFEHERRSGARHLAA